jgi:hypothetical protein
MDVVIGSAEVSATGGHQALQDGEALTVARVSECGAYFPTANSLPIRPTHHHQRGNSIGPLFEYNSIRVVIEMTPART